MIALKLPPANDTRPKRLASRRSAESGNAGQGGNWIRKKRRHAIYARDSLPHGPAGELAPACCWCGRTGLVAGSCASDGATLDHFLARERGGSNETANLLTCCFACNSARGSMPALSFASELANDDPDERAQILNRIFDRLDAGI